MEKIKTFETLKSEVELKRYLGSPYGTMYYPPVEPTGEKTMVRHFDRDLPAELILEYVELYSMIKDWIDTNSNVKDQVFMANLVDYGKDYVIRSFYGYYISLRDYLNKAKFIKPPLEFERMKKVVIDEFDNSLKDNVVLRRIIENTLLKPNGRTHYDSIEEKFFIAEPKITLQDLEEWRDLKKVV